MPPETCKVSAVRLSLKRKYSCSSCTVVFGISILDATFQSVIFESLVIDSIDIQGSFSYTLSTKKEVLIKTTLAGAYPRNPLLIS